MAKSLCISLLTVLLTLSSAPEAGAQVRNPVKWSYSARPSGKGKYEVVVRATLEKGWHLYSQATPDGGPIPTAFKFTRNPLLDLAGPVKEVGKLEKRHEKLFGVDVHQFSNEVTFVQSVTVKGKVKTNVSGSVEYMVCNDTECLPPATQNFSIELK
jgi:thiol:disulfide interchange protein DsbD